MKNSSKVIQSGGLVMYSLTRMAEPTANKKSPIPYGTGLNALYQQVRIKEK